MFMFKVSDTVSTVTVLTGAYQETSVSVWITRISRIKLMVVQTRSCQRCSTAMLLNKINGMVLVDICLNINFALETVLFLTASSSDIHFEF